MIGLLKQHPWYVWPLLLLLWLALRGLVWLFEPWGNTR